MDTYIIVRGFNGDDHYYVIKTYGNGSIPIYICDCGNTAASNSYATLVKNALIAAL